MISRDFLVSFFFTARAKLRDFIYQANQSTNLLNSLRNIEVNDEVILMKFYNLPKDKQS